MTRQTLTQQVRGTQLGAQLLQLIASGQPLTKAAKALGVTPKRAETAYAKEMARVLADNDDLRGRVFATELENLRLLRAAIMPRALQGEPRAVEVALAVGRDFRDLLGMTEAVKVDITVRKVDEAVEAILGHADAAIGQIVPLRRISAIEAG